MSHLNKKALGAGAAMVALSAFVPNLNITDKLSDFNLNLNPVGEAFAQAKTTASLKFNAKVSNPLALAEQKAVNFGTFAIQDAGKISISTGGVVGGSNYVNETKQEIGVLDIKAPQGVAFSLSLTKFNAGEIKLVHTGGGGASSKTMTVTKVTLKLTASNSKQGVYKSGTKNVTGFSITSKTTVDANVGALLEFDADQLEGTYAGQTDVMMTL